MTNFHFIVSEGPKVPQDKDVRTLIRKQAMRDIGITRRKRNYRGPKTKYGAAVNEETTVREREAEQRVRPIRVADRSANDDDQACLPASSEESGYASSDDAASWQLSASSRSTASPDNGILPCSLMRTQNPPLGYEALQIKYGFDLMDLSFLTSFHISQMALWAMQQQPELLATLVGHRVASYLKYVPSRYGHQSYFDAVVDCLLAKASSRMRPHEIGPRMVATKLYAKALCAVQKAVMDKETCGDADLLCAVQMLSCYEVSDLLICDSSSSLTRHYRVGHGLAKSRSVLESRWWFGTARTQPQAHRIQDRLRAIAVPRARGRSLV